MVFVCPTKEESENITQIASKIKDALQDVENKLTIGVKPICVPCCVPLCDYPAAENKGDAPKKEQQNNGYGFDPPPVMFKYTKMVFVCPTKEESENITQIASKIKDALQDVENKLTIGVKPICVPCCVPLCDYPAAENKGDAPKKEQQNNGYGFDPPPVMVCYREISKKGKGKQQDDKPEEGVIRLQQSKSRELRASILYTGCQCEKRNGLQHDCPRTGCHGSPECITQPPTCGPSEFCDGKHLQNRNKYTHLNGKNGNGKNGEGESSGGVKNEMARYKCFAATVETPIVCCPPCAQLPPFL